MAYRQRYAILLQIPFLVICFVSDAGAALGGEVFGNRVSNFPRGEPFRCPDYSGLEADAPVRYRELFPGPQMAHAGIVDPSFPILNHPFQRPFSLCG